jgi:hypothetical protein
LLVVAEEVAQVLAHTMLAVVALAVLYWRMVFQ